MAAHATNQQHRFFWAGEDESEDRISLIAEMAANIREDAALEPETQSTTYESKARGCELLVAEFIGSRGLIKSASAGSAKVDFESREEALSMARQVMGSFAVAEAPTGSATGFITTFPNIRG